MTNPETLTQQITILKSSILEIVIYCVDSDLLTTYLLDVGYTYRASSSGSYSTIDYLFGEVDIGRYANDDKVVAQSELTSIQTILDTRPFFDPNHDDYLDDRIEVRLLSNDLNYGFHFRLLSLPQISVDLSSSIFGKGTHYNYITFTFKFSQWYLHSQFDRGKIYNRYKGDLNSCLSFVFQSERELEHPYQYMIDKYPEIYQQATQKKRTTI